MTPEQDEETPEQDEEAIRFEYAERVKRAFKLIKPKPELRDYCRDDVERAFIETGFISSQISATQYDRTKKAKKAAKRLALALKRVENALKDSNLHFIIKKLCPRDELIKWRQYCEEAARTPSGKLLRKKAEAKRLAVTAALDLLLMYGGPVTATKGSNFCRLAALLYGSPKTDLHSQCREALRKKRGRK